MLLVWWFINRGYKKPDKQGAAMRVLGLLIDIHSFDFTEKQKDRLQVEQ
jgi:hypothetical protein